MYFLVTAPGTQQYQEERFLSQVLMAMALLFLFWLILVWSEVVSEWVSVGADDGAEEQAVTAVPWIGLVCYVFFIV